MSIKTVPLLCGGKTYQVPEMTFARIEEAWPTISELGATPSPAEQGITPAEAVRRSHQRLNLMVRIIASAMRRSHPEMTYDEIRENLTYKESLSVHETYMALLQASGLLNSGEEQPSNGVDRNPPPLSEGASRSAATSTH